MAPMKKAMSSLLSSSSPPPLPASAVVQGAATPTIVGAAKVLIFGIVPCSTGSSINRSLEREGRQSSRASRGPVVSASGISVWANVEADTNGDFIIELGVIRNSGGGGGGQLSAMLLANQCSVVVTTPLAACNVSLAGVTGTLSAPVQVVGGLLPCVVGGLLGLVAGPFSFI